MRNNHVEFARILYAAKGQDLGGLRKLAALDKQKWLLRKAKAASESAKK